MVASASAPLTRTHNRSRPPFADHGSAAQFGLRAGRGSRGLHRITRVSGELRTATPPDLTHQSDEQPKARGGVGTRGEPGWANGYMQREVESCVHRMALIEGGAALGVWRGPRSVVY